MKKSALLFLNGEVTRKEIRRLQGISFDIVLAADGGAFAALKFGYLPHYVVGDLDSVTEDIKRQLSQTQFIRRPSQEVNDLEKALQFCREIEVSQLTILGMAGKRLDHTLNNLSVLSRYDSQFKLTIFDAFSQIFLVRQNFQYQGKINQTISLIPMGKVEGITTRGLGFPLNNETLEFGKREGLSNYTTDPVVSIQIKSGLLIVIVIDK